MTPFLDALASRVLVCDGAMGTMLYGKGVFINRCFESLNLSQPGLVSEVHREYLAAGADVIETNTFGASRLKLRAFGLRCRLDAQRERTNAPLDGFEIGNVFYPYRFDSRSERQFHMARQLGDFRSGVGWT